jgi:hypothetical protein
MLVSHNLDAKAHGLLTMTGIDFKLIYCYKFHHMEKTET